MPAIQFNELIKRKNFAQREPGVILVFCIVGTIGLLVAGIYLNRYFQSVKASRPARPSKEASHDAGENVRV